MEKPRKPTASEIYAALDNDLAWDNLEHDLPAADLADLEHSLPGANGEDF